MTKLLKIVVTVPKSHAELVRQAMGDAGAGVIGNYHHCCAIIEQIGYSIPGEGAHPAIGTVGKLEKIVEDRIEAPVEVDKARAVIAAIRKVHPYEEPVIDLYELITL